MKNTSYKVIIPTILFVLGIIRITILVNSEKETTKLIDTKYTNKISEDIDKRESITFILGEDKEKDNPFYAEATNYYYFNEKDGTEYVITDCRSLKEVQSYLTENKPVNNLPWGLINLVSHGNQWLGLSVKVTNHSKRATAERIIEYTENDSLMHLSNTIIDDETEIFIHACGVGNNKDILDALGQAFSGGNLKPKVRASKLFEFYTSEKENGIIRNSQRYYADAQFISYKMGYRPEDQVVVNMLNQKYPKSSINFNDAMSREQPRYTGDTYHYTFDIPVKWVIKYEDSASYPDLSNKKLQNKWISEQKEITDVLKKIDIPQDKFNWWHRDVYVNNEDGTQSPAVWLKGYCTILCVLKPRVEETNIVSVLNFSSVRDVKDVSYNYAL